MTLRLLCDEHVGDPVYPMLADRFDVKHVLEVLGPGTPDKDTGATRSKVIGSSSRTTGITSTELPTPTMEPILA